MSIAQGLVGAADEVKQIKGPWKKVKRIGEIGQILCAEMFATLSMVPYGLRAYHTHLWLPDTARRGSVILVRDVRYGTSPRATMDIYLPPSHTAGRPTDSRTPPPWAFWTWLAPTPRQAAPRVKRNEGRPAVLFCHGGVWAAGEKWHYAPMATRLAQAGVVTCVMSYTLYPEATVPAMTAEVDAALTWLLRHGARVGASPERVTVMGHSAGAQLSAMALLHRAKRLHRRALRAERKGQPFWMEEAPAEDRMPKRFVGMCGCYDIARHYEYERGRKLHLLSTMERAIGGRANFNAQSPSVILARSLEEADVGTTPSFSEGSLEGARGRGEVPDFAGGEGGGATAGRQLHGEAMAAWIGAEGVLHSLHHHDEVDPCGKPLAMPLDAVRMLPPVILMASFTDTVVPWYESGDLHHRLLQCGARSKLLCYHKAGHADFAVDWHPLPAGSKGAQAQPTDVSDVRLQYSLDRYAAKLPQWAQDVMHLVSETVTPTFTTQADLSRIYGGPPASETPVKPPRHRSPQQGRPSQTTAHPPSFTSHALTERPVATEPAPVEVKSPSSIASAQDLTDEARGATSLVSGSPLTAPLGKARATPSEGATGAPVSSTSNIVGVAEALGATGKRPDVGAADADRAGVLGAGASRRHAGGSCVRVDAEVERAGDGAGTRVARVVRVDGDSEPGQRASLTARRDRGRDTSGVGSVSGGIEGAGGHGGRTERRGKEREQEELRGKREKRGEERERGKRREREGEEETRAGRGEKKEGEWEWGVGEEEGAGERTLERQGLASGVRVAFDEEGGRGEPGGRVSGCDEDAAEGAGVAKSAGASGHLDQERTKESVTERKPMREGEGEERTKESVTERKPMREGEGESERAREKKAEVAREGRTEVVDEVNGTGEPREGKNNSNGAELDLETQMRAVAQLKSFAMSCVSALLPSSGAKDRGKVEGEGSREDTRGSDRRGNERSGGK